LTGLPFAEKATALSPRKVLRHPSWWPVDPKPAACRQARGRWRLNDRKVVQRVTGNEGGNAMSPRRPSKSSAGGFSHGGRQAVSKSAARSRVLVTQNVGCRSGIRGILTVRPRKAERPHEGVTSSDGEGNWPGRGWWSFAPQKGADGRAKGRKARSKPLDHGVRRTCLAQDRASNRDRRRCVGSWIERALNPLARNQGPGFAPSDEPARRLSHPGTE
jgi:hypothetical protein